MLNFSNWENFIVSLSLIFEMLSNMCIVIICFTVYEVITFEINISFLRKLFFYMIKIVRMIPKDQKELL